MELDARAAVSRGVLVASAGTTTREPARSEGSGRSGPSPRIGSAEPWRNRALQWCRIRVAPPDAWTVRELDEASLCGEGALTLGLSLWTRIPGPDLQRRHRHLFLPLIYHARRPIAVMRCLCRQLKSGRRKNGPLH